MLVRVDVSDLQPGERLRAPFDERVLLHVDGQGTDAEARGELLMDRTVQGLRLRGRIDAQVPQVCSRCLVPLEETVRADLDEEFRLGPSERVRGGELGPEDFVHRLAPGEPLDVTEIVRQQLQLAVPMAPLCRPDCRGLCPYCGANWNERACEHGPAAAQ